VTVDRVDRSTEGRNSWTCPPPAQYGPRTRARPGTRNAISDAQVAHFGLGGMGRPSMGASGAPRGGDARSESDRAGTELGRQERKHLVSQAFECRWQIVGIQNKSAHSGFEVGAHELDHTQEEVLSFEKAMA
jgi:hypothetical protein